MSRAVERLLEARKAGELVALVGDYDADGVSGLAILVAVFRACGLEVEAVVPHRMREGYGFQPVHVEHAQKIGARVIVTVDCGTTSHRAAAAALEVGIGVIVTDHHLPDRPLPDDVVHINPSQKTCSYPFKELSGAGLALKLALALAKARDRTIDPRILLRVACLGTIADLVPLRGENRVIAAIGLQELARARSPGIRALLDVARVERPFSAADVGYRLGPRLNAPGRLDSAEKALQLLLCRDAELAGRLAAELDGWNQRRQTEERRVTDEASEAISARPSLPPILVAWSESWHRGVVGVAAGRLARRFNRPVILLAVEGQTATGSGRSIDGIDLHDFLRPRSRELTRFGGHSQAIGMTVEKHLLEDLRDSWEQAAEIWNERIAVRRFEYELDLEPGQISPELMAELSRLEPHGQGNPQPLIRIRGPLHLPWKAKTFGRGHMSTVAAGSDGSRIPLLGWGWQERLSALEGEFEVLGFLEKDRYRGTVLRLVDSRPCPVRDAATEGSPASMPEASDLATEGLASESSAPLLGKGALR